MFFKKYTVDYDANKMLQDSIYISKKCKESCTKNNWTCTFKLNDVYPNADLKCYSKALLEVIPKVL